MRGGTWRAPDVCCLRAQALFTRGSATVTSTMNPEDRHLAGTGELDSILDGSGVAEIEIAADALTRDDAATTVPVIGWTD
jgi:hypothetical protein